jgi:hypothetical protein
MCLRTPHRSRYLNLTRSRSVADIVQEEPERAGLIGQAPECGFSLTELVVGEKGGGPEMIWAALISREAFSAVASSRDLKFLRMRTLASQSEILQEVVPLRLSNRVRANVVSVM